MIDHFFVEAIESATIADLRAMGHDAEAADYAFDSTRGEKEQLRELREALQKQAYGAVFLERPWSDAMVRALEGVPLVAYARPELVERGLVDVGVVSPTRSVVRALIDAKATGRSLREVAGLILRDDGRVVRTAHAGHVSVLADLRDASFDHVHRRSLSRARANVERAVVLANYGCAYRNVPNKTSTFDAVEMPNDVSTAGCTFCDASAYERMTEEDAIALVVRQVRALLRDRPEVVEIALKDDYAIRYLEKLGHALRPLDLGGRELLLSARADYLLEFRDDVEAALAGRFPCRLGFYLVGFENFSHVELERFNKGISPEQLERAMVLMRDWSTRFPRKFRVSPTGGFILFTPWTTMEDLRINADAIRRLNFTDFRGRALLSQLRLYPNVPLHWLAKRDGLLLDAFPTDATSDAHRRGYEADRPWRFRDERVGRVHARLLEAAASDDAELLSVLDAALDDEAGVARGKQKRPLRMVRAPNDRGPRGPATHAVALNRACNQSCAFCNARGVDEIDARRRAARAIREVQAAARAGRRTLVLGGAEPTLEWYLVDLVRLARDLGIAEVVLETNATTLAEGTLASDLARAGLTRAVVAINSLDESISDAITRDAGGLARTRRGIRALLDAAVPVELAVALLRRNRGALADLVTRARAEFPASSSAIEGVVVRAIFAAPNEAPLLDVASAAEEVLAGARASRASGLPVRSAPGGELPPCVFDDAEAVESMLRLSTVLVERDAAGYARIDACDGCEAKSVCAGPVRAVASSVAGIARPLRSTTIARAVVPISDERRRVLLEYRSQFFLGRPEGRVDERRIVRVNFHCNQACDFCFVSRELPQVEDAVIEKEIAEAAAAGAVLDLSGGEPTLNSKLADHIALARRLGLRKMELQTNAIKMADREYARTLADAGLQDAFVSLHGVTAATSDRVTAAPGTFVRTIEGIRNLLEVGVRVRLNWVLCGYNVDELPALPDFLRATFDGHDVGLNFSYVAASTDNVPRDTRLIPRFSDVAWALERAHARASELGIEMTGFDSKCGVPACYLPESIRREHFAADVPDAERKNAEGGFAKSSACARCGFDRRCYGVRATYAEMYGTSELRPLTADGSFATDVSTSRPDEADAPLLAASPSWCAKIGVLDREVAQLRAALRSVIKVERRTRAHAEETAASFAAQGFATVISDGPAGSGGAPERVVVFPANDGACAEEAASLERALVGSFDARGAAVRRMGALLGYPECCVDAFARSTEQDDATHIARLTRASIATGPLFPEQNWAAVPIRLFSHFPCAPTCAATLTLAKATRAQMLAERPAFVAELDRALASIAWIEDAECFVLFVGARFDDGDAFRYEHVLSHRNLGVENAVLSRAKFRAFYRSIVAPLEAGDRVVRTTDGVIVERRGRVLTRITLPSGPPSLLDFTGLRRVRRLPLAEGRQQGT
jgi:MoaA/NifB/PqqE/SkfB family radical SAM enzyme